MTKRMTVAGLAVAAVVLMVMGCGGGERERPAVVISMVEMNFEPKMVFVDIGETVTWRNNSDIPHTVTADPQKARNPQNVALPAGAEPFDSGDIAPGGTFRHTFDVPGLYRYFCKPHEGQGMVAEIQVGLPEGQ